MKNKLIIASLIFLFSNITYASLYPEAAPCNPSVLGTYCEIHPKIFVLPEMDSVAFIAHPSYCSNWIIISEYLGLEVPVTSPYFLDSLVENPLFFQTAPGTLSKLLD